MPVKYNKSNIRKIYVGDQEYSAVFKGKERVWPQDLENTTNLDWEGGTSGVASNTYHTVTFKTWDDEILIEQMVLHGEDAELPKPKFKPNHDFVEWDGDYTNVTSDRVIEPVHEIWKHEVTLNYYSQEEYYYHIFTDTGSDTFEVTSAGGVDIFLVGGGAGGSNGSNGGGGGGHVRSWFNVNLSESQYSLNVGDGGYGTGDGESTTFETDSETYTAAGGNGTSGSNGGDGGSGGGGRRPLNCSQNGGEDGSDGNDGDVGDGGSGQGFSTREFNQRYNEDSGSWETIDPDSTATLYGSGGGGYGSSSTSVGYGGRPGEAAGWGGGVIACSDHPDGSTYVSTSGLPNRGGGGGSTRSSQSNTYGGSGIVIIRYPVSSGIEATGGSITTQPPSTELIRTTQLVEHGSNAILPSNTDRVGFTFSHWNKSHTNITTKKEITALYNINSYNVTFSYYSGTSSQSDSQTIKYGSKAVPPKNTSREGYNFLGWEEDLNISTIYPFPTHTFTNAGSTGRRGPTLNDCQSSYNFTSWTQNTDYFNMATQGIQEWTVPATATYRIEAYGAQGGGGNGGGLGAKISGEFKLNENEVIHILVGQEGERNGAHGGGGGGTFVVKEPYNTTDSILVVAGGGGSVSSRASIGESSHGQIGTSGGAGARSGSGGIGTPGTNGGGGSGDSTAYGGAGFYGNGNGGAQSFINGGVGDSRTADGGFGGGGGANTGWDRNAGGGGYSGGAGARGSTWSRGGGGGSYNSGSNQENESGVNSGHGHVTISLGSGNYNTITESKDFIAQYGIKTYKVTFIYYENDEIQTETQYIEHGNNAISPSVSDYGYFEFKGWLGTLTNITSDRTIIAKYELKSVGDISEFIFTNAGSTGRTGPTLSDCESEYNWHPEAFSLHLDVYQGIQEFTIPQSGTYNIEAYGAGGGTDQNGNTPGRGAKMSGDFNLTEGQKINILVGQRGTDGRSVAWHRAGGGGGGSFVWDKNTETPLIIAGGGAGNNNTQTGNHGSTNIGDGNGGSAGSTGSAGAGWNSNGATGRSNHTGGVRPLQGGQGGNTLNGRDALGGFGGGGAAANDSGSGGGYQGGDGPNNGGLSYNEGSNQDNESGVNSGHGYVIITRL